MSSPIMHAFSFDKAMNLFSLNLVKFLRKHDFDGVLIDYEFPNMKTRGSMPYTKHGFSLLLKVRLKSVFSFGFIKRLNELFV